MVKRSYTVRVGNGKVSTVTDKEDGTVDFQPTKFIRKVDVPEFSFESSGLDIEDVE